MITTRRTRHIAADIFGGAFAAVCAVCAGVVIWLAFLAALAGPPPGPECKRIHDGEILVASTLHADGRLECSYVEATALYGRGVTKRAGK